MKFQHFFKVHQISSNLQNILESSSETCMWNLSPFREVNLFHRKMLTVPALWNIMKFNIFSKFTKFHQTCRTYLNHHQKHACEIWANSEKLTYFIEKCWQCRAFELSWNFNIFQSSPNFIKLAEFIGIIIRNMHVKFEPIQRGYIFSQKNADSACPRNIMKFQHFFKVHQISSNLHNIFIGIIIRNMHVHLSPFREDNLFHRKMPTVPALEISWNFNIFSKFAKFHQTCRIKFQSSSEKCMWHLSLFREVILFHRKMSTVRALEISWKFNTFFKYT